MIMLGDRVLVHDLIAIALGHLEGGEHGSMDRIQQNFQLGVGAAFVEIDSEEGHTCILEIAIEQRGGQSPSPADAVNS